MYFNEKSIQNCPNMYFNEKSIQNCPNMSINNYKSIQNCPNMNINNVIVQECILIKQYSKVDMSGMGGNKMQINSAA